MQSSNQNIIVLVLVITPVLLLLSTFIIGILYVYQKKQTAYENKITSIKTEYENALLNTQLEIQEQTIQNISRDIHDNINLTLTLAKLNLNTTDLSDLNKTEEKISSSIDLISSAIQDLSNLSRSMNSDLIKEQGLIYALKREIEKIKKLDRFDINIGILGEPIYLESQKELFIFRIIQEAFNNILKHSNATAIGLQLNFRKAEIQIEITDNGKGFKNYLPNQEKAKENSGLINMHKRARVINGEINLLSKEGTGTIVQLNVPY